MTGRPPSSPLFPYPPLSRPPRAPRQPAQDGELAAMVDVVKQDRRPQEVADRPLVAAEILERAVQVRRSEPSHPPDRLGVDPLVARGQRLDCFRPLDAVRLHARRERALLDAEA